MFSHIFKSARGERHAAGRPSSAGESATATISRPETDELLLACTRGSLDDVHRLLREGQVGFYD